MTKNPFSPISPLALCALLAWLPTGSASALLISEVLYDAEGADNGKVFVELFGSAGFALDGFTIEGVNGADGSVGPVLGLSGSVPEDGFFVVADQDGGASLVDAPDLLLDFDLQNGPDSVVLRGASGQLLDALGYGVFDAGAVFAGEGSPAPDPPAGFSLARRFADVDTGDNAADFVPLEVPTPGLGPVLVPEPSSALLLAAALTGIGLLRRSP